MIHVMVGHEAVRNLEAAFELDEDLRGPVVVLRDTLGIGSLMSTPEIPHDTVRTAFWQQVNPLAHDEVGDEKNILELVSNAVREEEPVCFWMAPCVSDVMAYFWLLQYFKPHPGMLHVIAIGGLPFLNEKGQLFYPINFSQVPAREFIKTKRLLKEVSVSEYELDGDEWKRLQEEDAMVRIYEGGKKILSKDAAYFDLALRNAIGTDFQKATKVINEAQKKITQTLSHQYLEYRLRLMMQNEAYEVKGESSAALKDLEIRKKEAVSEL